MPYPRTHVRQALSAAREAGRPVEGLKSDDRETTVLLEKWGYLPVDQDAADRRIADWYVSQGLAIREGDTLADTPEPTSDTRDDTRGDTPGVHTLDVLAAAESALETARVALSLARSMAGGGGQVPSSAA
jgi:hypothetical protein